MDHRGDFELAARSTLGETEVTWTAPRLILLAGSFNRYDQYAVNRIDERIELWTYTLYGSDLLAVDLLSRDEVPEAKERSSSIARPSPKPASSANEPAARGRPAYDLDHHVGKMSANTRVLFDLLRDQIMGMGDDVTERFMNQYVGYRRLKNFTEIVGLRSKLNVFVDGVVNDPTGVCEDVSGIGHWGTGNLRASVASEDDVLAVMPLIAQAYALQG